MQGITLVKVGGAELAEGEKLEQLVQGVKRLASQWPLVVVHGGGVEIAELQQRLGIVPQFVEGLRVTDEESLRVAEMVLSGVVNKRLTARLVMNGLRAIGISGIDGGLLRARRIVHPKGDLGHVGEVIEVDTGCLNDLLSAGFVPVISPISLSAEGRSLNVNADHAALAVAGALSVAEAIFLTDVPGVLCDGAVLCTLNASEAQRLIDSGQISGGMIPKVHAALRAIERGVGSVRITNLVGLAAGSGTRVLA
jgi:acetylglutamate kinase